MIAQAVTGTPGHVNSMALAVEHFLHKHPLDSLQPGDVLASNDPWLCSGHLHDFTLVTPVFHRGKAVGAVANTVHVVDIGGLGFGPDGRDTYEEGICLPILKLARSGVLDETVLSILQVNVREPDQVVGDLHSSVTGNAAAARNVEALLVEYDIADLEAVSDAILERTRQTVEKRIAALPMGTYQNELVMDGYEGEVRLKLSLTIEAKRIVLDFAGSSQSFARGINVVLNYATAYAAFGVNCVLNPDIPCNYGSLAPIVISAPEGCVLNTQRPSPTSARHMIGHMLPDLVLGALSQVMPIPAEGAGLIWNPSLRGRTDAGRSFATVTFNAGGAGAQHDRDGWSATAFPSGVKAMPVETVEASAPVIVRKKELRADSGGAGQFRGGLGQIIEVAADGSWPMLVNAMFDRVKYPARGRNGAGAGACGVVRLASGKTFASKGLQEVPAGDTLILELPGGGGHGDPTGRDRLAIENDLRQGYITADQARTVYGIADA